MCNVCAVARGGQKMLSDPQELELQAVVSQQLKVHFSYTVSSRLISGISVDPPMSQKKIKENLPLLQNNNKTKQNTVPQFLENLDTTYS